MAWMKTRNALPKLPALLGQGRFSFNFDGMPLVADHLSFRKKANLLKCGLDLALKKVRLWAMPPALQIEPTNLCNLNCPLCPTGTGAMPREKGMMSRETFQKILLCAEQDVVSVILYSWGEPFLNKDLPWMIAQCSARGIVTVTSTNGHCLQSLEEAQQVVDSGLKALVIALDGSTQEIYQAYRKSGDVEKVKRCAALIEQAKAQRHSPYPYTNMRVVVTSENERDLPNLKRLAQDMGMNMFSTKTVGSLTEIAPYSQFETHEPDQRRFQHKGRARVRHRPIRCVYPFRQPTIFWDGTVVGCEFDYGLETAWGRIGEQPFAEIWNGAAAMQLRRVILSGRERPRFCALCPYQDCQRDSTVIACEELRPLGA